LRGPRASSGWSRWDGASEKRKAMTGEISQGTGKRRLRYPSRGRRWLRGEPRHVLLGSEVYVVENLDRVPPFCPFAALPLKIRGGLPVVRAVALLPGR
jgi:hypothetical protein